MKEIVVTSQAELDALPIDVDGRIVIKFGTPYNRAVVNRRFKYSVVAWGNSSVEARENSSVVAWGNTQVVDSSRKHQITVSGNARIVYNPTNIDEYLEFHGIEDTGNTVKLYIAVHKREGRYFSDSDRSFEYVVGGEAVADRLDKDPDEDCGHGIHIAHKAWAVDYGRSWSDLAIIEVEAIKADIIVPLFGSGKVRVDKVKVLREVPLEECGILGKMLAKQRAAK